MGKSKIPESLQKYFDQEFSQILEKEQIPGASVVLLNQDDILYMQGFGYRDLEKKKPVTTKTQFAIGSTSKAFTATVLGMLVDEGKLKWDDLVIDYIPEFRMLDPVATMQLTVRDIQCHRSGLPRHDLAWLLGNFSRTELMEKMRYLEPFVPFRSLFHYNNFMWMVAGIVGERITGKTWEENVQERILKPLGMRDTNFSVDDMQKAHDYSYAYDAHSGEIKRIPPRDISAIGPAGSINAHIEDYAQWLAFNIKAGAHKGKQLISAESLGEIHAPQMAIPVQDELGQAFHMMEHFSDLVYTLGWVSVNYRGRAHVMHAGGIDGYSSFLTFMPKEKIGAAVLTNSGGISKHYGIVLEIIDRYLGDEPIPWIEKISALEKMGMDAEQKAEQEQAEKQIKGTSPSHALDAYCGSYTHPAYGTIQIEQKNGVLGGLYNQIPCTLSHFHYDVFNLTIQDTRMEFKFPMQFFTSLDGQIDRAQLPLEAKVKPIEFKKKA